MSIKMILFIDNYDSFVHILVGYTEYLGFKTKLYRNDKVSLEKIEQLNPQAIILSPGPSTPDESGICLTLIEYFKGKIPILGICLGHQAIAQSYGAEIIRTTPVHGIKSNIHHQQHALFDTLPPVFQAARYHSLCVEKIPKRLEQIAYTRNPDTKNIINMAIADDIHKIYGIQFHPESILTPHGLQILKNFLTLAIESQTS